MKFSELWLREWVNPGITSKALYEQIAMAGLEIEGVESVAKSFHGVIIGEVTECIRHAKADKLNVAKVNIGNENLLNIVCGASNCRAGIKVAVATIGATMPGNLKIKATKLRGELSEGMLCSSIELGISQEHEGIVELPKNAPIGKDIRDYLQLNDNTIEIKVTPNRADCLGIIGIARDISAFYKMELTQPNIRAISTTINSSLPIDVHVPQACPRYLGRVVKGINIKSASPLWMREKLRRSGIQPTNAVINITNYVLLELGQPIDAFDLKQIEGGIIVRMAEEGETLRIAGDKKASLNTTTLVIADYKKILAIAGICGGQHSTVNNETQDVLIGCAFFSPLYMIGHARSYGLQTDASYRYERGVDPCLQYKAIDRAISLLLDICNGQAGPIIDITNQEELPKPAIIDLRRIKLDHVLGHKIPSKTVSSILHHLGFKFIEKHDTWFVIAPSWRFDIKLEEDLVEEVARVYGYEHITRVPIRTNLITTKHTETNLKLERVKTLLVDHGFQEAITYSFVNPKIQILLHPSETSLALPNPISTEMSVMRLSLWTGLLSAVVYNQKRQQSRLRLFESGLRFVPDTTINLGIRQDMIIAGVMTGNTHDEHWDLDSKPVDFYDLKGEIESIIELTGRLSEVQFLAKMNPALHPGQSAAIYLNETHIGFMGVIHPAIESKLHLNSRTLVFELEWEKFASYPVPQARKISRFQANRRDIAVVVAENIAAEDILIACKKIDLNQIVEVKLFDVYRGNGVPYGYKSLAIGLVLQDITGTLEEEEIAATVAKCVETLRQRFHASLRD